MPTPAPPPRHSSIRAPARVGSRDLPRHEIARMTRLPAPPQPPRFTAASLRKSNATKPASRMRSPSSTIKTTPTQSRRSTLRHASRRARATVSTSVIVARRRARQRHHHADAKLAQDGEDCYYGRYEYTYPDGARESGNISWPFCYDPATIRSSGRRIRCRSRCHRSGTICRRTPNCRRSKRPSTTTGPATATRISAVTTASGQPLSTN